MPAGSLAVTRPSSAVAGPSRRGKAVGDRPGVATQPLRGLIDQGVGQDRAAPVGQPVEDGLDPRVADVGHDRRATRRAAQPRLEGGDDRSQVGEDIGVVPLGAGQDRQAGLVGVEVAGVFVGFDDERVATPPAGGGRWTAGDRRRQQRPDECRRVGARRHEEMDQPARGRALAMRPGHPDEGPTDCRVGDDLLPRLDGDAEVARRRELGVVGIDRGQRLGDRQAIRA